MAEYIKRRHSSLGSHSFQEQKKKDFEEQKRFILYLILDYTKNHNLQLTYETLKKEAQLNEQFVVCDNIDLELIFQEFQSYYNMKYQRDAKIIRKLTEKSSTIVQKTQSAGKVRSLEHNNTSKNYDKHEHLTESKTEDFSFQIVPIGLQTKFTMTDDRKNWYANSDRQYKPLTDFPGYTEEWKEMADQIIKQFVPKTLGISWNDCMGLEEPIELLKEATIYPLQYTELFQNITSWNGILLYGPPGTGKTLLAKALACESDTYFINVTSSTFVSKWRGDSEKMIKVMFDLAKYYAPTTIFIDEIDALLSESKEGNHEASCRFKSELLIQMDGLLSNNNQVFLLATTNSPWKLDKALLRRFEKRILIPIPNFETKMQMLKNFAKWNIDNRNDLTRLVQITDNFSGSDIKNVCKELEMRLIREQLKNINENKKVGLRRNPSLEDIISAIKTVKPSLNDDYYKKILHWHQHHGSN
ncbi:hypothetical protein WA026_005173 [Henosepilachna vigintioctopunctata]|uniref:AAA+ ATPase domain-containing protein n=1 Tax=Henosepilachna vigintioctopunctata TaxID=420089 RepID=A0AAW1UME3_9CUCU